MPYTVQNAIVLIRLHPRLDAIERKRREGRQDAGTARSYLGAISQRQPRRALILFLEHGSERPPPGWRMSASLPLPRLYPSSAEQSAELFRPGRRGVYGMRLARRTDGAPLVASRFVVRGSDRIGRTVLVTRAAAVLHSEMRWVRYDSPQDQLQDVGGSVPNRVAELLRDSCCICRGTNSNLRSS